MSSPTIASASPAPAPRPPMGVVLAAIVLALMTCMGLLSGASVIFSAIFIRTPQLAEYPMIEAVQIVMGILILLFCGFFGWTVVGLFRTKRWARFSILVLGGLLAFFSFMCTILYCVLAFTSVAVAPETPGVPPGMMKAIFLGMAGFSLVFALIGIWWLVYFNLRRIRMLFAANGAWLRPEPLFPTSAGGVWIDPYAPKRSIIETLLTCLAVLYLLGSIAFIVDAFLQMPIFFLGYVFRGASALAILLAFSAVNITVGIGILRRIKAGWVGALAINAIGVLSMLALFIPHVRAQMAAYQQEIFRHMFGGTFPAVPQSQLMQGPIYLISVVAGSVMLVAVIWLLLLARPLFEPKNTPA